MTSPETNRRGQGLTEYIIIVALIAIAAIGVVMYYGDDLRHLFAASSNAVAGNESTTPGTKSVDQRQYGQKDLKDFGYNKTRMK